MHKDAKCQISRHALSYYSMRYNDFESFAHSWFTCQTAFMNASVLGN